MTRIVWVCSSFLEMLRLLYIKESQHFQEYYPKLNVRDNIFNYEGELEESIQIVFYNDSDEEPNNFTSDFQEVLADFNTQDDALENHIKSELILDDFIKEDKPAEALQTRECAICKEQFSNYSHLYDHLTTAHFRRVRYGQYICGICSHEARTVNQGLIHYTEVHDRTVLGCHICQKRFKNTSLLRRHITGVHSTEGDKVCCAVCGIILKNQMTLDMHRKQQHQKPTFPETLVCQLCGNTVKSLAKHMLKVHGDSDLQCKLCNKLFASKKGLDHHLKLHSNQRPFQCQYCGKGFISNTILQIHLRRHPESGVEPFQCVECGHKFNKKGAWADHMSRHSGKKPYECEFCEKKFGIRKSLYSHRRFKHPDVYK